MADNGKIIRNGAEIQIDENGNVVARPAAGQEFIVEDNARVGTLEAEDLQSDRATIDTGMFGRKILFESDFSSINDAISSAKRGQVIEIDGSEETIYDEDVSIDQRQIELRGAAIGGARIEGGNNFAISASEVVLRGIREGLGTLELNVLEGANEVTFENCKSATINVGEGRAGVYQCSGVDVNFEADTANGVAIGNRNSTITDNGNNEVLGNT